MRAEQKERERVLSIGLGLGGRMGLTVGISIEGLEQHEQQERVYDQGPNEESRRLLSVEDQIDRAVDYHPKELNHLHDGDRVFNESHRDVRGHAHVIEVHEHVNE